MGRKTEFANLFNLPDKGFFAALRMTDLGITSNNGRTPPTAQTMI